MQVSRRAGSGVQVADLRLESRVLNHVVATAAVRLVADDWMFEPGEMHADLMRAAGFEFHVEQCETMEAAIDAITRQRAPAAAHDGHACAV